MAYLNWQFPLPRTHTGALLGNGVMGLMVWGDESLHITVGRAGFGITAGPMIFLCARPTWKSLTA